MTLRHVALVSLPILVIGSLVGSTAHAVPQAELKASSPFPFDDLPYRCSNHDPSHYANTPQQVTELTARFGCMGWEQVQVATGSIAGLVADADGAPIAGAQIRIRELGVGAVTDAAGHFFLSELPGGQYTVVISRVGYGTAEIEVQTGSSVTIVLR